VGLALDECPLHLAENPPLRRELEHRFRFSEAHPPVRVVDVVLEDDLALTDVRDEKRDVHDAVAHRIVERIELAGREQRG
jgi:hypothetical protein